MIYYLWIKSLNYKEMLIMENLKTRYLGFELKNPIIVASCGMTGKIEGVRKCYEAGAGAIVLKSLFEEQIFADRDEIESYSLPSWHTEAFEYVKNIGMSLGPENYIKLIKEAKKYTDIPIIASLNCVSSKGWLRYARQIESAGADAIEINMATINKGLLYDSSMVEEEFIAVIENLKKSISIPIAIKIGPHFSSLPSFAHGLKAAGAGAVVIFNRFYQFDIDTDGLKVVAGNRFSSPDEISLSLRWTAILSGILKCDIAAARGIHTSEGVIKQILAGACAVQICSTLYINGLETIGRILEEISAWMERKGFNTINDFKGKLSQKQSDKPELYHRLQYIKALVGIE